MPSEATEINSWNLAEIRSEFEVLALTLLTCTTLLEYNEIKGKLELLGGVVQSINSWLNWWVQRRFNLFPIFKGYCISSLNLAEIGHSHFKEEETIDASGCCMGRCSYNDAAGTITYSFFAVFTQVHGERAICCTISCERENSPEKEEQRLSRVIQSWCQLPVPTSTAFELICKLIWCLSCTTGLLSASKYSTLSLSICKK